MSVLVTKPPLGAEVDWARPINRDLVGCWLLNEGMGTRATDLAYGEVARPIATYAWREGLRLQGGDATGYGECWRASNTARLEAGLGSMTLLAWATVWQQQRGMTGGIRYGGLAGKGFLAGASGMGISVRNESLHVQARAGATFIAAYASTPNIIDGRPHLLAGILDRERAQLSIHIDGKKKESTDATPLAGINLTMPTESFTIGSNSQSIPRFSFLGHIHAVMVWKRALSADEIAWLYSEPYAGIRTVERPKRYYSISRRPRVHHVRRPRLDPRQKPPLGARVDPEHSLSKGLVRYWVCNEGIGGRIGDVAANDDGVRHPLYWAEGALQFPGGSYYIVGNPLNALSGPCTYLCWFSFPPSAIPSEGNYIRGLISNFKHAVSAGVTGISLSVLLRSAYPHMIEAFFGTGVPGANYIRLTGTPSSIGRPITANTYGCAAMTYDGTRGRLYFDGQQILNGAASVVHAANPWILGRWATNYGGYIYNGLLRNIRIYNRALTDDEIAWLYAEPYAGLLPPTSRRIYSYSRRGIIRARAIDGTPFGGSIIR